MLQLIPLANEHLEAVAVLVGVRYRALRQMEPLLLERCAEPRHIEPLLSALRDAGYPGVAAVQDGALAGFLGAWLAPDF